VTQCSQQNFIVSTYDSFEKFDVKFGRGTFLASRCTSIACRMHLFLDSTETTRRGTEVVHMMSDKGTRVIGMSNTHEMSDLLTWCWDRIVSHKYLPNDER
jgi:hypothetical protein